MGWSERMVLMRLYLFPIAVLFLEKCFTGKCTAGIRFVSIGLVGGKVVRDAEANSKNQCALSSVI